jgi:hypothetical protein
MGVSEWAGRIRELRDDENWPILTHNNCTDLKPGQYLLKEAPPEKPAVKLRRPISATLRAKVLDRDGFTCHMCGIAPGDIDQATNRMARLEITQIKDMRHAGKDGLANLRALCSTCNRGAKNITAKKPTARWLVSLIGQSNQDEQLAVLKSLGKKLDQK